MDRTELPSAPAAERNFAPILGVLRREFLGLERILEIGAGTGQHAAGFAAAMPWLDWQPSDLAAQLPVIERWVKSCGCPNIHPPLALDVSGTPGLAGRFDGAYSANTAHIMSEASVRDSLLLLGARLESGGRYCLYGPFRERGEFNTESNAQFDVSLRRSDPSMGIRDIETLDDYAAEAGLRRIRQYAMPGNNLIVVFERLGETEGGQQDDYA